MALAFFVIVTVTFFLMKAIPGDPFTQEKNIPREILQAMYKHYGLNDPLLTQYLNYLKSILSGDLGPSFKYDSLTVNEIIKDSFPVSALLGLEALLLSLSMGMLLGTFAALKFNRWQDHLLMLISVMGISIPSFILATFLQYIFAMKLKILPVARFESFAHSILPALSLCALPTAMIARLIRSSMLEVLQQDYIKTAHSKGLSRRSVLFRHTLRNSLMPVVTYLGTLTANILMGSFVVEKIFGIPGLGQWFVIGITNRDYTVIMGITVFESLVLLLLMFTVDFIYAYVDPRIKMSSYKNF